MSKTYHAPPTSPFIIYRVELTPVGKNSDREPLHSKIAAPKGATSKRLMRYAKAELRESSVRGNTYPVAGGGYQFVPFGRGYVLSVTPEQEVTNADS